MGSSYVVCSTDLAPAAASLAAFEAWLGATFADARVVERGAGGTHALGWTQGDRAGSWLRGWVGDDRTAVYLDGDLRLVCAAALEATELFPSGSVVVLAGDSQGIPFDLRRFSDVASLVEAVERDDDSLGWKDATEST